jgi:L-2-hydroxyglutarate oxidase LhgO
MRPKINAPHEAAADFMIQGPAEHGVPGLVNLLGIESPGLTSSLAIAQAVVGHLRAHQTSQQWSGPSAFDADAMESDRLGRWCA